MNVKHNSIRRYEGGLRTSSLEFFLIKSLKVLVSSRNMIARCSLVFIELALPGIKQ